uniref:Uncharacterized protein n=1 Tax=Anguilla anguilla TaxID=7936 RepID=A0A0E9PUR6_ANGAN
MYPYTFISVWRNCR